MKKVSTLILSTAFLLPMSIPVYAAEKQPVVQQQSFTYQQAVENALKTSIALKNAAAEIDRSFEIRQNAGQNLTYTPVGKGNGIDDALARGTFKGVVQADVLWGINQRKYELTKDNILYSVKNAYNNVLKAEKQKQLADLALNNEALQKRLAETKTMNGLMSQFELTQENSKYDAAVERQKAAIKAVEDAYQKLNSLIGLPKDSRPLLVDEPKFAKFEVKDTDLESHISWLTSNSNAVWMAEEQVKLKQLDVDLYTYNDPGNSAPYKAREIDVIKARNDVKDTKKNLEDAIRSIYINIKQLEDRYEELNIDLATAEETLKMARVRYQAGLGIKADLSTAELAVASKKKEIFDVIVQLDNLKFMYEKPWVK